MKVIFSVNLTFVLFHLIFYYYILKILNLLLLILESSKMQCMVDHCKNIKLIKLLHALYCTMSRYSLYQNDKDCINVTWQPRVIYI